MVCLHNVISMKAIIIQSTKFAASAIFFLNASFLAAQGQTYSPYTPSQIQEFNNQPLSPVEGPFGPVDPRLVPAGPKSTLESGYIQNPEGEEQAEAQGAQSAAPFEPIPSTISF